jgi:hypothetical protein
MKLVLMGLFLGIHLFWGCNNFVSDPPSEKIHPIIINDPVQVLTDLKKGDILVKPNHNWLPGTVWVNGGNGFGHAAIVLEGANGASATEILSNSVIFESHARDVADEFQLRSSMGYKPGTDFRFDNITFSPVRSGVKYRLRFNLSQAEIDSLVAFVLKQDNGLSSWRSLKSEYQEPKVGSNLSRTHWYCSHLIREAFLYTTGLDLDSNGGLIVYPNDLIGANTNELDSIVQRFRF